MPCLFSVNTGREATSIEEAERSRRKIKKQRGKGFIGEIDEINNPNTVRAMAGQSSSEFDLAIDHEFDSEFVMISHSAKGNLALSSNILQ